MSRFKLEFRTANAAFADGNGDFEIAAILRKLADRIADGDREDMQIIIHDSNGNSIGDCVFTLPEREESD